MKIAIPTNDKKTITKRTGQSKIFAVYEITDNKISGLTRNKALLLMFARLN